MGTRGMGILLLLTLLMSLLPMPPAEARVVHSMESFDVVESSVLSSTGWEFKDEEGWSGDDAQFTSGMSADSKVSFTHSRPLNLDSTTFWVQDNSSDQGAAATGAPDGYYTWTQGPEVVVDSFDVSTASSTVLKEVFLVVSFSIPGALTQDSVRFSLNNAGHNELVKTWAHTQSAISKMSSPYWELNISSVYDWDWNMLSTLEVTLDYVSVGGTDDTQLQVDAVGLRVIHQKASWGLETSVGSISLEGLDLPVMDLNLTMGEWQGLTLTSCGLEPTTEGTSGTWTSAIEQRPHGQDWGRLSLFGDSTATALHRSSDDADTWTEWKVTTYSTLLDRSEYIQVRIEMDSGCLEGARIDINDPTLSISINVHGDVSGIIESVNQSLVQISIQNEMAFRFNISNEGVQSKTMSVGHLLPSDGEDLQIHLSSAFAWNDNGSEVEMVVEVTSLSIDGGFSLDWDEDPVCDHIDDVVLTEDGGGALIPLRCTDDRTPAEELEIEISSEDEELIEVDMAEGQVRVKLLPEASGQTRVQVKVTDRPGMPERNTWQQSFDVTVGEVNDPPVFANLPSEILVSLPESSYIQLEFSDVDDDSEELSFTTDYSWASVEDGRLRLQPVESGQWELTVTLSDGVNSVSRVITVVAMALPDLHVESVEVAGGEKQVMVGDVVEVVGWVRNLGQADADFISIRCLADGKLIGVTIIDLVAPGQLRRAVCDWEVPGGSDAVLLSVVADYGLNIRESDEDNNEGVVSVLVEPAESSGSGSETTSAGISSETKIGGTVLALIILIAAFMLFAPKGIRKIE